MTNGADLLSVDQFLPMQQAGSADILDAGYYAAAEPENAAALYEAGHIPGARFFDIEACADRNTALPHMLPTQQEFSAYIASLGVTGRKPIVIYDRHGLRSAPRVWWSLRRFGFDDVRILSGGFPAWIARNLPIEQGQGKAARLTALPHLKPRDHLVVAYDGIVALQAKDLLIDGRHADRFRGEASEPWTKARGAIPNSCSLPASALMLPGGLLKSDEEILKAFEAATGLERAALRERRLIATCGSGIAAAILAFAAQKAGLGEMTVYDGSFAEWGRRQEAAAIAPQTVET